MKRLLSLLLAAILLAPMACAYADETASDMCLEASQGTVSVTDGKDKAVTVRDGMKLFDAYCVTTGAESHAWINLDQTKALKLDAESSARINKNGDKLVIDLEKGALLVDVSVPLRSDEALDIRTSTTLTGVRGTVFFVKVQNDDSVQVGVLEGSVSMTYTDPNTGKTNTTAIDTGMLGTAPPPTGAGQSGMQVGMQHLEADDVDGFVLHEIRTNPALAERLRQSESAVVRSLVPTADVAAVPVYVQIVLTTGNAAEVEEFKEALEDAPNLVVKINDVEIFKPGTDVELGANQTINLTGTGLDLEDSGLTNAGTVSGDSDSSIQNAGSIENTGVITIKGTIDAAELTNSGTVNIGAPELTSEIDKLINNSGGVINVSGILITCSLDNKGVINILNGGEIQIRSDESGGAPSAAVNSGVIEIKSGTLAIGEDSNLTNHGDIENSGDITNDDGATITNDGDITNNDGATITNDGDITNNSGATIDNSGTITNNGTITNDGGTFTGTPVEENDIIET